MKNSQTIHKLFLTIYLAGLVIYLFFYFQWAYNPNLMGNASFPWIELSIPIGFVLLLIYIHYKLLCYNFSSDLQSTFIKLSCLSLGIFVISGSHLLIVQPKELAGLPDMIGLMISGIFWMAALIAGLGSLWNKPKIQE